jgi:hypothetical protein
MCLLYLNRQRFVPRWVCFTQYNLIICSYFYDILQNTHKAVESVIIYSDGTWTNKDIDMDHPDVKSFNNFRPIIRTKEPKLSFTSQKPEVIAYQGQGPTIADCARTQHGANPGTRSGSGARNRSGARK